MSKKLRTALVIVLATLGSLVVIFLILWATWTLTTQTKSVASFVPADKTVLLLHWPTQATYDKARELFPSLIPTTLPPDTAALALIETATGSFAQVIFLEETNPILKTLSSSPPLLPPFAVIVSDAKLTPLIGEHDGNLADSKAYKNIRAQFTMRQPWSYARRTALPQLSAADALLAATFFGDATSVGVGSNSGTIILSAAGMKSVQGISNSSTHYLSQPFLILHGDRLRSLFQAASQALSEESATIAEAGLSQIAQELLGNNVSLQYDLLPLLSEEATLELKNGSGGNLLFTLYGENHDSGTLKKTLTLLQKSADDMSSQVEIQDHLFDEKFPARNVRTKVIEDTTKNIDGWKVVESKKPDGSLLIAIATSGNKFMVTNSPEAATLKQNGSTIALPSEKSRSRGSLMASGYFSKDDLYRLLQRFTVGIQSPALAVPSGTYLWSLRVNTDSRTLLLEPVKKTGTL